MKKYIHKLNDLNIPNMSGKIALFISVFALAIVASANNAKCLSASTCAVGSDPTFEESVGIKGGTAFTATLGASLITDDRAIELPDADGTLALQASALAGNKIVSTDVSGDLTTTTTYPITLTASKVAKTDSGGLLTTGEIDITTDIDASSASTNDEIRVDSGGNLEFFTPASSGGAYTLIDSGTVGNWGSETFVCWYGNTLDPTKRYKFIFDSGTGMNSGEDYYIPAYVPVEGDCTSSKNEWEGSSIYANAQHHVGQRANSEYETYGNQCYTLQGNDQNNAYAGGVNTSNLQGDIEFSAIDNGNGYGFWSLWDWSGVSLNSSGNITGVGIQWGNGSCIVWEDSYTNPFADITGFFVNFEGGTTGTTRSWALYEIDY